MTGYKLNIYGISYRTRGPMVEDNDPVTGGGRYMSEKNEIAFITTTTSDKARVALQNMFDTKVAITKIRLVGRIE